MPARRAMAEPLRSQRLSASKQEGRDEGMSASARSFLFLAISTASPGLDGYKGSRKGDVPVPRSNDRNLLSTASRADVALGGLGHDAS
jgi:hypothetical protein